jgi:hypothetical protein
VAKPPRQPPKSNGNHKPPRPEVADPKPPKPTLDKKTVLSHFRAAQRDYKVFKKKYGSRLESDWNDLALFVTFVQNSPGKLPEFDRKISQFRSKMRKQSGQ